MYIYEVHTYSIIIVALPAAEKVRSPIKGKPHYSGSFSTETSMAVCKLTLVSI